MSQFELVQHAREASMQLPGGYKQRLPWPRRCCTSRRFSSWTSHQRRRSLARRAFWRRITALAEQGVTVIVTTHFMQEAEYCDRIAIMDAGRVLAQGAPGEIRRQAATREQPNRRWKMHSLPLLNGRATATAAEGRRMIAASQEPGVIPRSSDFAPSAGGSAH